MTSVHDYFAEDVASGYDVDAGDMFDPAIVDPAVDVLADLAGTGAALELGIGTGRIALPLAARGVHVHGVDSSAAMVQRLRAKPGGANIEVLIGDFVDARVDGTFTVAYLVFNTIMNLTTQAAQVSCFTTVADHLRPGGCFVIEVMVPQLRYLPPGQTVVPFHASDTSWGFDTYDVAAQRLTSHHIAITDVGVKNASIPFRYVWPAELDLMAQLAGLQLRDRWADWTRAPFTSESAKHISIWQKPAAEG